jgi:hypothetical protein
MVPITKEQDEWHGTRILENNVRVCQDGVSHASVGARSCRGAEEHQNRIEEYFSCEVAVKFIWAPLRVVKNPKLHI